MSDTHVTPLGPYTKEIRDHYVEYKSLRYMIDHPGTSRRLARRNARIAWARKVTKAIRARVAEIK